MARGPGLKGLLSGTARANPVVTLVLASLVTALVAVPMAIAAVSAEKTPNIAPVSRLIVDAEGARAAPVHNTRVSGEVMISYLGDGVEAVAFALAGPDGEIVAQRVDGEGPSFDLFVNSDGDPIALDTTRLPNGRYELLVSLRNADDSEAKTAAAFTVDNGQI